MSQSNDEDRLSQYITEKKIETPTTTTTKDLINGLDRQVIFFDTSNL